VRNAIRELEASIKQLEARRKALEYAEKQYEAEKMKFDVGTSTNFQVLDFQNRLAQSRNTVLIAQIRYNKALVDYETAIGMTLKNNGVTIETAKEGTTGASMGQ
jgi:outer membrane protein TolC